MNMSEAPDKERFWTGRIWAIFSSAFLLASNLFLFGPLNVYVGNIEEFEAGFLEIITLYIFPYFLIVILLMLPAFLFKKSGWKRYASFLFGLGILLWIQGNFLMRDYGVLDAHGIDWKSFDRFVWLDVLLWVVVILVATIGSKRIVRAAPLTCWTLVMVQTISLAWQASIVPGDVLKKANRTQSQPPSGIFQYSPHRNILHIVMDSLQTDVFWELAQEKELENDLEGFVLFWDNAGVAPYTSFAIPALFSGRVYDGTTSEHDYYSNAMKNGFQERLFQDGYRVNLIPTMSMEKSSCSNYYRIPGDYKGIRTDLVQSNGALLFDVALFRQVPHLLRRGVYNQNNWFVSTWFDKPVNLRSFQQRSFFQDYIERLEVHDETPTYNFLHLWPPHPPYAIDKNGNYTGAVLPNTRENYKNEARAILAIFGDLLKKLKQLGIYDETLIILQGDHGSGIKSPINGNSYDFIPPRLLALLAIKRRAAVGPTVLSQAQTSIADIPRSILEAEGLDSYFPGDDVFTIDPNRNRTRWFIRYKQEAGETRTLVRYSINGSIYEKSSYKEEGLLEPLITHRKYQLGKVIKLGLNGNGESFIREGWSTPMDTYNWSRASRATLDIPLDPPPGNLAFTVTLIPNIQPEVLPRQRIGVLANGKKVADWVADDKRGMQFSAFIPRELAESGHIEITFELPDAASPQKLGFGAGSRDLAIALFSFRLDLIESNIQDDSE